MKKKTKIIEIQGVSSWEDTIEMLYKASKKLDQHTEDFADPVVSDIVKNLQKMMEDEYSLMLKEIEEVLKAK